MRTYTLNLNPTSPIYKTFVYPAGETQVRIRDEYIHDFISMDQYEDQIRLIARIKTAQDIIETLGLIDALKNCTCTPIDLILPYMPYARADRVFLDKGDCFGAKIFSGLFDGKVRTVATLDVHSNVQGTLWNRTKFFNASATGLIYRTILKFAYLMECDHMNIVFPDKGAKERYNLDPNYPYRGPNGKLEIKQFYGNKIREADTGKLTGFSIEDWNQKLLCPTLVVDDLCDGGGTFLGLYDQVLMSKFSSTALYVTHGIFSQGFAELGKRYNRIYTTDSFRSDFSSEEAYQYDAAPIILTELGNWQKKNLQALK